MKEKVYNDVKAWGERKVADWGVNITHSLGVYDESRNNEQ